jgi:hypothetical protein
MAAKIPTRRANNMRADPAYAGVTLHRGHTATINSKLPTRARINLLNVLNWWGEMWWHDMPPATRNALLRRGWTGGSR